MSGQWSEADLIEALGGILSFPVTPFRDGAVDLRALREHVRRQVAWGPAALFAAAGTGEFFSLTPKEHHAVVGAVAEEAAGRLPVFAGIGYGTALALEQAHAASAAGADGLLVLPPYLVDPEQEGLLAHYRAIAAESPLPLIVYERANATFTPDTVVELSRTPKVLGLKDGRGDFGHLAEVRQRCPEDLVLVGGLPTAEVAAARYRALGITGYSSALLNFVPEVAIAFRAALEAGDTAGIETWEAAFLGPFTALRDEVAGFAVALVKAAVGLRYGDVGPPRPPLVAPDAQRTRRLAALIDQGLATARDSGIGSMGARP